MNEIDLTKIFKNCPKGTKFYSNIFGYVEFVYISYTKSYPIEFKTRDDVHFAVNSEGKMDVDYYRTKCTLFPSIEQRDWSKFTAPWYKKEKFDPRTLKEFDKVLVKEDGDCIWRVDIISVPAKYNDNIPYLIGDNDFDWIIPYNEDTQHLIGTNDEAPEFYKYWES